MEKYTRTGVFLILILPLLSNLSLASPLTAQTIEHWLQSQSALEEWGKNNEDKFQSKAEQAEDSQIDDHRNPMDMSIESIIQPLKSAGLYDSAKTIVNKYRFNSLEDWADVTIRITTAAAVLEYESNPKAMDTTELEALQNSPQISPQQKKLITQAIEQNKAVIKQLLENTNDADKQAIKPFLKRIHQLMNEPY